MKVPLRVLRRFWVEAPPSSPIPYFKERNVPPDAPSTWVIKQMLSKTATENQRCWAVPRSRISVSRKCNVLAKQNATHVVAHVCPLGRVVLKRMLVFERVGPTGPRGQPGCERTRAHLRTESMNSKMPSAFFPHFSCVFFDES